MPMKSLGQDLVYELLGRKDSQLPISRCTKVGDIERDQSLATHQLSHLMLATVFYVLIPFI
jgi:hypothetical protein